MLNYNNKEFFQNTIKNKISISGIGLFTGKEVNVTLFPASEDHGVVFKRIDLNGKPVLPANVNFVEETDRSTFVGFGKKRIQTIEHILSALAAYNIDNVLIEVDGPEIPIKDGSAKCFAELFEKTGIEKQRKKAKVLRLTQPVYFTENHISLVALPSDEYKISFTIHHPKSTFLTQYYPYLVSKETYIKEIAPARTFSIYEEIKPLLDNNFIKGGSLDNAVVIKDDKILNPEGVRFSDEMVRHKILDLMGDLYLIAKRFTAHIIAIKSGHLTNVLFAKKLINFLKE